MRRLSLLSVIALCALVPETAFPRFSPENPPVAPERPAHEDRTTNPR